MRKEEHIARWSANGEDKEPHGEGMKAVYELKMNCNYAYAPVFVVHVVLESPKTKFVIQKFP